MTNRECLEYLVVSGVVKSELAASVENKINELDLDLNKFIHTNKQYTNTMLDLVSHCNRSDLEYLGKSITNIIAIFRETDYVENLLKQLNIVNHKWVIMYKSKKYNDTIYLDDEKVNIVKDINGIKQMIDEDGYVLYKRPFGLIIDLKDNDIIRVSRELGYVGEQSEFFKSERGKLKIRL